MSKSYGGPKQAIMVQKWPFLKPKSKLKSNIHQKLWNKKIFIFMNCTKKSKENKEFWPFYTFIWKNEPKFDTKKVYFTVFVLKKVTFLGLLRAKYTVQSEIHKIKIDTITKWMKI